MEIENISRFGHRSMTTSVAPCAERTLQYMINIALAGCTYKLLLVVMQVLAYGLHNYKDGQVLTTVE